MGGCGYLSLPPTFLCRYCALYAITRSVLYSTQLPPASYAISSSCAVRYCCMLCRQVSSRGRSPAVLPPVEPVVGDVSDDGVDESKSRGRHRYVAPTTTFRFGYDTYKGPRMQLPALQ
jgi:hypothetical protein